MHEYSLYIKGFLWVWGTLAIVTSMAFAHGTGQSFEQEAGQYLIDVGTSESAIQAGSSVTFDFDILTKDKAEHVPFTNIWVRIEDDKKLLFAGGIVKASIGKTAMTYVFPQAGAYTLTVRFQNRDNALAEAVFPITIEPALLDSKDGSSVGMAYVIVAGIGGLIIGFLAALILRKRSA